MTDEKRVWDVGSLVAVAVAALVACWPIFAYGYPRGHDWIFGLVRVVEYRQALASGQLPPLWVLSQNGGAGGLLFLFYGHGFLALSSLVGLVAGDPVRTASITLVCTSLIGGAGAYLWGRAAFGPGAAARLTSVAFVLGPYLACNRLLRTSNAELMAMCLMPFAFAGLAWIREKPSAGVLTLGFGLGAAVASHNMVAIYGVGAIVVCALVLYLKDRTSLLRAALGTAFGLALSAFYWLPAFALRESINAANAGTYFAVTDSFLTPGQWGGTDFHTLGWPLLIAFIVAAGLAALWGNTNERKWAAAGFSAALIALWMTLPSSRFVWETVPLLEYFQFTWRIFGLFSLGAPIVLGAAVAAATRKGRMPGSVTQLALVAACFLSFHVSAKQAVPVPDDHMAQARAALNPEGIRTQGLSATVGDQFVPAGANVQAVARMGRGPGDQVRVDAGMQVTVRQDLPERLAYRVRGRGGNLVVGRWHYPTWEVRVNDEVQEAPASPEGLIQVEIPPGDHTVTIELVQPPIRQVGNSISLMALLLLLLVARRLPEGADPAETP